MVLRAVDKSCRKISCRISCWCCLQTVAAAPVVVLMSMYVFHVCCVGATAMSSVSVSRIVAASDLIKPVGAVNLYFHSANVA